MQKIIEFADKVALNENPSIPDINKVKDTDINEIKSVVNGSLQGTNAMGSIVVDDVNCKNLLDEVLLSTSAKSIGITYDGTKVYSTNPSTDTRSWNYANSNYYLTLEPGTYTISLKFQHKITNSSGGLFRFYKTDDTFFANFNANNVDYASKTFELSEKTDIGLYFKLYDGQVNIQIEKGSEATPYTPYKKIIKEENGYVKENTTFYANDFKCKNLFIPTKTNNGTNIALYQATLNMEDDEFVFTATGTAIYFGNIKNTGDNYADDRGILIDVEGMSSISYTLTNPLFNQTYITRYDSSKKSLGYVFRALSSGSYDIPAGTKYITLRFGINNTTSGTTYRTKVQLEVGSEATPYTPYKNFDNTPIITQLLGDTTLTASTSYALSDAITNYKYIMLVLTSASTFENANRQYIPVEQIQGFNNLYRCALSVFQSTSVYMFADMYFADATHIYCNTLTRGTTGWAGHLKVYGIK